MSERSIIDTNFEAYRLVNDPTRLLHLLFTKYGDIEEDYNILISNQIIFNKLTHINSIFKENILNNYREFLRRIYNKKESKERIPKLYDYYKNYYNYFCKPFFLDFSFDNLFHKLYNRKAQIFYKNNYSCSNDKKNSSEDKKNSNSFSSFDNDTDNKIIFDKKNKYLIDNSIETNKYSITLTYDNSIKDNNKYLISKRSVNDSFEINLKNFIKEFQINQNKKNQKNLKSENNKINNNNDEIKDNIIINNSFKNKEKEKNININNNDFLINHNKENNIRNILLINNEIKKEEYKKEKDESYYNKIKDESINIMNDIEKTTTDIIQQINNNNKKLAIKLSRNISELEKNNIILNKKQSNIDNMSNDDLSDDNKIMNDMDSNKNDNSKNNLNMSNKKYSRNNMHQNFLKLSNELNHKNKTNFKGLEFRNSSKKENDLLKLKEFITLKNNNNNNHIKIFKLSKNKNSINNNFFNKEENKPFSIKNSKKEININRNNGHDNKLDSKKFNTIFKSNKKAKSNKKLSIFNKFSPLLFNKNNAKNIKLYNNKQLNYNSESIEQKNNILFRNELNTKKKSKTSDKISPFNSLFIEKNSKNKKNKENNHKNNLSYFNYEYEKNNFFNNIKSFNSDSREKRNSNLISKNFLFKNYAMGKILLANNNNSKINENNNIKNFIYISRNKNKTITKAFHSKSIPLSLSQSKSTSKEYENNNLLKALSFKNNKKENKKIYISNIKIPNKNEIIIKNSKIIENNLGKNELKNNSKNSYKSFGIKFNNGIFSPINLKKSFNFNQGIFKNNKK